MMFRLLPFALAVVIFGLDRGTKLLIQQHVSAWDSVVVIPNFFSIVHTENRGAAFGMFSGSTGAWHNFLLVGLSLAVLVFVGGMLIKPNQARGWILRIGLGLIMGGALGNVYDRITTGTVTDFLDFYLGAHEFPSFNVADSAISAGAGLLLLDMWRSRERKPAPAGGKV